MARLKFGAFPNAASQIETSKNGPFSKPGSFRKPAPFPNLDDREAYNFCGDNE